MVDYTTSAADVSSEPTRNVTAFFDTQDAAEKARADLVAAGISPDTISMAGGVQPDHAAAEGGGFWHALKEFFMPEEDRYTFAEGLRRGGFALSVGTSEAHYDHAVEILDADGAVDIDEREQSWRNEGWSGTPARDPVSERVAYAAADARSAGFGGSLAGDDGYAPSAPLTTGGAVEDEALADAGRVGSGAGTPDQLNPDFRERIGSGTASMTPSTATGSQDATTGDNAANMDRGGASYQAATAAEVATLGNPTRSGAEMPAARSTLGSMTSAEAGQSLPADRQSGSFRRDEGLRRTRVRGYIRDPLDEDRSGTL